MEVELDGSQFLQCLSDLLRSTAWLIRLRRETLLRARTKRTGLRSPRALFVESRISFIFDERKVRSISATRESEALNECNQELETSGRGSVEAARTQLELGPDHQPLPLGEGNATGDAGASAGRLTTRPAAQGLFNTLYGVKFWYCL